MTAPKARRARFDCQKHLRYCCVAEIADRGADGDGAPGEAMAPVGIAICNRPNAHAVADCLGAATIRATTLPS